MGISMGIHGCLLVIVPVEFCVGSWLVVRTTWARTYAARTMMITPATTEPINFRLKLWSVTSSLAIVSLNGDSEGEGAAALISVNEGD